MNTNSEDSAYANKGREILLEMLAKKGIDGLIRDLRQNGGGNQAISIAGRFIKPGPVQVKDSFDRLGNFYNENEDLPSEGHLIVRSSSMSALASEVLIRALHDHRRAIIGGAEATYRKGGV
jgi:carboxyl-terminal processing protease